MNNLNDDLLKGVSQIAEFQGESMRRVYYLLERGLLPGFKRGSIWYARKSSILRDIEQREREARSL